jgi:hypothetical protein
VNLDLCATGGLFVVFRGEPIAVSFTGMLLALLEDLKDSWNSGFGHDGVHIQRFCAPVVPDC